MPTISRFEDVESWKMARIVCCIIGGLIDEGRFQKNYALIQQVEASSGSIMDNIAEGFERGTKAEFVQFLGYAKGSCAELRSQLYRIFDRCYITQQEFDDLKSLLEKISGSIHNFIRYLLKTNIEGLRKKRN